MAKALKIFKKNKDRIYVYDCGTYFLAINKQLSLEREPSQAKNGGSKLEKPYWTEEKITQHYTNQGFIE